MPYKHTKNTSFISTGKQNDEELSINDITQK